MAQRKISLDGFDSPPSTTGGSGASTPGGANKPEPRKQEVRGAGTARAPMRRSSYKKKPEPGSPEAILRKMSATLRGRARWLDNVLPERQAQAMRLLPALLHARFPHPSLKDEPIGVEQLRFRSSWLKLVHSFDIPPPTALQRGRCLVQAVFAAPTAEALELVVIGTQGSMHERDRIERRCAAAQEVLVNGGAKVRVSLRWPPFPSTIEQSQPTDKKVQTGVEAALRAICYGALLGGKLPNGFWPRSNTPEVGISQETIAAITVDAPTPLCALPLMLLCGGVKLSPEAAMAAALERGMPASRLSDPELFCTEWASQCGASSQLWFALREVAKTPLTRNIAQARALQAVARKSGDFGLPPEFSSARAILSLGRALALACASAIRHGAARKSKPLRERLSREVLRTGLPAPLLPALGVRISTTTRPSAGDPMGQKPCMPVKRGKVFEVLDGAGTCLGRGQTPDAARIRAVALCTAALGRPLRFDRDEVHWRKISEHLWKEVDPGPLFVVEPHNEPGPPFDPLNRGPERHLGFGQALLIRPRDGRRPTAQRLPADKVLPLLLKEAVAGAAISVVPATAEADLAATRLSRLTLLVKNRRSAPQATAIEAGGAVFLAKERMVRRYSLSGFSFRPRAAFTDPEAPDLTFPASMGGPTRPDGTILQCLVSTIGANHAGILYSDGRGNCLREEVPIGEFEEHLAESIALLRTDPLPSLLGVRVTPEVEATLRRGVSSPSTRVIAEIEGDLPFGLFAIMDGERFGGASSLGWDAAAQAVLSRWPTEGDGRIAIKRVQVDVNGIPTAGLLTLYVRSFVRRKLLAHIKRLGRPYRFAGAYRFNG